MLKQRIKLLLRRLVRSDRTPLPVARLVQMVRLGLDFKQRLHNPLRHIPELETGHLQYFLHGSSAVSSQERAKTLVMAVEQVIGGQVQGDIAEFGTMTGTSARYLAAAMSAFSHWDSSRHLHLFDSFEGFPEADNDIDRNSPHVASGIWGKGECYGIGPSYLSKMCRKFIPESRIHIHAGWFNQTLPLLPKSCKFALVHLDCDLYQSTLSVLDDLFTHDRLTDGAVLLFDDWYCNRGNPDMGQQRAWKETVAKHNPRFELLGMYANCSMKVLIHAKAS